MGCFLDELCTGGTECSRKVVSGRRVAGTIRSLINARDLQLECAGVLHETLLVPIVMYGSEKMFWKEKEISRIMAVQMENLRGLFSITRMDTVPNARIWEWCRVKKGLDERIDEGMLHWSSHVERMENDVGECAGSRSVGRLHKR